MLSFEKSIGGVIYRLEGNQPVFLLLKYPGGYWDFVKGHQEKGETDEKTLKREAEEETGIRDLKVFSESKKTIRYFYRAKGREKEERMEKGVGINVFKRVVFYLAETETREIRISDEHTGHKWADYEEAKRIVAFNNSKSVLEFFRPQISDLPKLKQRG